MYSATDVDRQLIRARRRGWSCSVSRISRDAMLCQASKGSKGTDPGSL